jgi:hypothetical protein
MSHDGMPPCRGNSGTTVTTVTTVITGRTGCTGRTGRTGQVRTAVPLVVAGNLSHRAGVSPLKAKPGCGPVRRGAGQTSNIPREW